MLDLGTSLLLRARTLGNRFFHRFGIHCATHQIRLILVNAVVITSLFYPALAIYSSSETQFFSTSKFLDVSGLYAHHDLIEFWSEHETLRVREDAVSRARCGMESTIRVERILIQNPMVKDENTLNLKTLLSTLSLEQRIENLLLSNHIPCLKKLDGRCLVLSPLEFWNHDVDALSSDRNIKDTLSLCNNISMSGIPLTPPMVLAGRGWHDPMTAKLEIATFLSLTYFFPENDCLGNGDHATWLQLLESAVTQNEELTIQTHEPTLIALEYVRYLSKKDGFSALSAFVFLAYAGFFAYASWSMRHIVGVHSRIGVTFTALVEIIVSTITSLSVCALVGFKVTMVPWELLPIVIVVVGAENMINLVDAVGKTSVTLPVKQRIAEGLSRAGTSNTLKVVSYNAILGIIAFFSVGAIRQFCAFAVVVLVAHWFLAHTFFITVLSIDMQRLELADLIRQNPSLDNTAPTPTPDIRITQTFSPGRKLFHAIQNVRATKNISLLLLLAITGTLYYTTYPTRAYVESSMGTTRSPLKRTKINMTQSSHQPPAWHIWKTFNPEEDPLLHLRLEIPVVLTIGPEVVASPNGDHKLHRNRFSMRTLRLLFWLLKIVVLPITLTTSVLYAVLLYLLKDADLLEAQRNRAEPETGEPEEDATLGGRVTFTALPRAFPTDVELVAASQDGQVVAAVGLQNEIAIWRMDSRKHVSIDATDILLRAASSSSATSSLTAVAIDDRGEFCAVGTGTGAIAMWSIGKNDVRPLPHLILDHSAGGVEEIHFINQPSGSPSIHTNDQLLQSSRVPTLIATYKNGLASKWFSLDTLPAVQYFYPYCPESVRKSIMLPVHRAKQMLIAFCTDDGVLELADAQNLQDPASNIKLQAGNPTDLVSQVHSCSASLGGAPRLVVVAATDAGVVSLWDGTTGECISIFDEVRGDISRLRISPLPVETCRHCGELPLEGFLVTLSVGHLVSLYKACVTSSGRWCSCNPLPTRQISQWEIVRSHRSRTNSVASSNGTTTPLHHRPRLSSKTSLSEATLFPVSGHGVHSRRASEKDATRRSSEILPVSSLADERDSPHFVRPPDSPPASRASSIWQNINIVKAAESSCERGGWNISGTTVIGLHRKPRTSSSTGGTAAKVSSSTLHGLPAATLDRWELWVFDPRNSRFQSSPLIALTSDRHTLQEGLEHIPRLPFTRVYPFILSGFYGLAGFGNTVGLFQFSIS